MNDQLDQLWDRVDLQEVADWLSLDVGARARRRALRAFDTGRGTSSRYSVGAREQAKARFGVGTIPAIERTAWWTSESASIRGSKGGGAPPRQPRR